MVNFYYINFILIYLIIVFDNLSSKLILFINNFQDYPDMEILDLNQNLPASIIIK